MLRPCLIPFRYHVDLDCKNNYSNLKWTDWLRNGNDLTHWQVESVGVLGRPFKENMFGLLLCQAWWISMIQSAQPRQRPRSTRLLWRCFTPRWLSQSRGFCWGELALWVPITQQGQDPFPEVGQVCIRKGAWWKEKGPIRSHCYSPEIWGSQVVVIHNVEQCSMTLPSSPNDGAKTVSLTWL